MDKAGAIFKIMICLIQDNMYFFSSTKNNVEPKKNNKRKARKSRKTRNIKRDKKNSKKKIEIERIKILEELGKLKTKKLEIKRTEGEELENLETRMLEIERIEIRIKK